VDDAVERGFGYLPTGAGVSRTYLHAAERGATVADRFADHRFVEPGRSLYLDRARRRTPGPSGRMVRHTARVPQLTLTQDPRADELLGRDPLALLLGMLFDQHMRGRSTGSRC
jgi:hypothetical protein